MTIVKNRIWNTIKLKAKQKATLMNLRSGEFFERLAFLVTFWAMQKVTRIYRQNLSFAPYSCIKRSCARSRAATDPGERHGARQMRPFRSNYCSQYPLYTCKHV